jgi:Methyltransferase domain
MDDLQGSLIHSFCQAAMLLLPAAPHHRCDFANDRPNPIQDWISDAVDIRQLLIETHHLAEETDVKPSDFFDDIQNAGFALFSKEPNIHPLASPGCSEWSFVKLDKSFFGENNQEVSASDTT